MKIETKRFGRIEIKDETILNFESGILGFSSNKRFVLIDPNKRSPLKWMQSVDNPDLAFVVTDPNIFVPDYEIVVSSIDVADIELEDSNDSLQLVIVTVPRDPSKMTANLRGPIIINTKNNKAKQLVLEDSRYEIKYRLLAENKKVANE